MDPKLRVGQTLDNRYEIARLIGRGAMADVYRARDTKREMDVALKVLRIMRDDEALMRFFREARAQEIVEHPNVAALYGGGATPAREPYLVVELLRGRSLRTLIRNDGRIHLGRAAHYMWQTLQGLGAVHVQGIHHRDLKPANIMLEPSDEPVERVVLIDFGFASLEGGSRLTQQGHVVGSLSYLSPERLDGDDGDERSDLYAVGVIFYELLTGRPPFVADDDFDLINLHLDAPVPPMRETAPDRPIPAAIEALITRALAKDPEDRWPSATGMARDLERVMKALEEAQ